MLHPVCTSSFISFREQENNIRVGGNRQRRVDGSVYSRDSVLLLFQREPIVPGKTI